MLKLCSQVGFVGSLGAFGACQFAHSLNLDKSARSFTDSYRFFVFFFFKPSVG